MRLAALLLFLALPAEAAGLIDEIERLHKDVAQIEARFVQKTYVALLDKTVEEEGWLVFKKGGRFTIHYLGDREREFDSNGKKLTIHYIEEGRREVHDLSEVVSREGLAFLSGLGALREEFETRELGERRLSLTPKNPDSPFSKIELEVDENYKVAGVVLLPKRGNRSEYRFSDVTVR